MRKPRAICLALLLGWSGVGCFGVGCSSVPPPLPAPVHETVTRPHVVTDLSSLSSAPTTATTNLPAGGSRPPSSTAIDSAADSSGTGAANPQRLFIAQPGHQQFVGKAAAPADEKLLNAKAAKFAEFSSTLLNQVLIAAVGLEHGEIDTVVVPDNINPTIITAVISKEGKLQELIIEQRSGSGALDRLMVQACKQGLWTNNPPPEALTNGEYQVRIEGRIKNFSTSDQKHWQFETHIGIALL